MKRLLRGGFSWRPALLPTITIVVLIALKGLTTPMYATAMGRVPAMMVEISGSRTLSYFRAPAGYYEKLLKPGDVDWHEHWGTIFGPEAFRVRKLRPNLTSVSVAPVTKSPTNRFGYLGPEWTLVKRPNTRRVAVLGDSIALGFRVNLDQNFVTLLANRLNVASSTHQQKLEFLNFAVPGYQLTQMMDVALQDVPQFHPDVYIVMLTELSVHRSWDAHLTYLVQSGANLKYDFLRQTVSEANAKQADDVATLAAKLAPYRTAIIRQTILRMKTNAEQYHAQFLVVLVPTVEDADISRRRFEGIPELLSSMDVTFIDLSDTFAPVLDRQSIRQSRIDIHPNAKGDKIIADALYEKLRANPDAWSKLVGPEYDKSNQPRLPQ